MKAQYTIPEPGHYVITVTPKEQTMQAIPMQLYRNRTRLASTDSLPRISWAGSCEKGDLIEADALWDLTVTVEKPNAQTNISHPRDSAAVHGQDQPQGAPSR